MDLAIAVPLYLAAEAAAADGIDRLAVGQGARSSHMIGLATARGGVVGFLPADSEIP
ncbi:MAG: hypothetical protein R6U36_06120 [Candidatus Fermentibacteraceae bacterium]